MTMRTTVETSQTTEVLLFGGHVLSQTKQTLDKLLQSLADGPNTDWITETLAGLPEYWNELASKIPEIAAVPGSQLLADLDSWLRRGPGSDDTELDEVLPNIVVGPLLVAIQLDQYWRYLEIQRREKGLPFQTVDLQADLVARQTHTHKIQPLGFCVGLLGSLAVSSSANRSDFERYGAAGMRMSMMIGALIDAREGWDAGLGKGRSVSYAIAWRGAKQQQELTRIIKSLFPEAYISVFFDQARCTVTTSERTSPSLVRQLRAAGLTVAEIGIGGHIHSPGPDRERHTNALVELCRENRGLRFADASELALPAFDNRGDGLPITPDRGDMTEMVLRSILMQQCNWYGTFSNAVMHSSGTSVVAFGLDRCIPPSLIRQLGTKQRHFDDVLKSNPPINQETTAKPTEYTPVPPAQSESNEKVHVQKDSPDDSFVNGDSIAVVGMSVKVAGADDLDEFVDMLKTGKSQHELVTRERLQHDMVFRPDADADPTRKFYANFVRDSDAFDHKFFKKSPREAQAMDPQSRLCLEGAYQAVEQSGYFTETTQSTPARDKLHVGVYLGNCGVDYEHNITCNPTSAFTATGGLKSFIVGRLSHYFGWTGPSITYDTACSSSAVAIHTACRNILSGECTAALCGGVNIVTNMLWLQNLAASSFISPTGQCKPFDEGADGYCRAEGMAFVFLKKLSDAVADGNPILATIPATAVYQNLNSTPLFVPNSPSLSLLFKDVIKKSNLKGNDFSLVEAHGTGTPVGDPAEYDSIRLALGGPIRNKPLPIGSVKGHIGHTEGASGVIALVKVIMMMRGGFIPPQASFTRMNHHINVRADDMMEIVTSLRPWNEERKVALINNYGACGSNASIVVMQPPSRVEGGNAASYGSSHRLPFWITGVDAKSIAAYSSKLLSWLQTQATVGKEVTLGDLSFAASRQSNRSLPQGLMFSCSTVSELRTKLMQAASMTKGNASDIGLTPTNSERPVVLCFGGQVSTFVGLDRALYENVAVLRFYLDECDAAITSAGFGSIYPEIFSRNPIKDTVKLQAMLLSMQYSAAKAWMSCGLEGRVSAVVGHSFGEITALCIAGVLDLADTVKLVTGRAKLVRDAWGPDSGAMMVVEADETQVQDLIRQTNDVSDGTLSIACYNGPRSFTLAGSTNAIDAAVKVADENSQFSSLKKKRLNVTNAFHSSLVDTMVDGLGQVGKGLTFRKPLIHIEHATETESSSGVDGGFVASHMRKPVYFNHAIHRLSKKYPNAAFLEAGSASTITVMASRALAQTSAETAQAHHFQSISLSNSNGSLDSLTDATLALWKAGVRVSFWQHHPKQVAAYNQILLPPYQFDKSGRHWLEMKSPKEIINKAAEAIVVARGLTAAQHQAPPPENPADLPLFTFVGYQDKEERKPRFRVNTTSTKYNYYFSGHVIAQTAPICPATLESDMAIEALFSLHPEMRATGLSPVVRHLVNHSPICADASRAVYMDFTAVGKSTNEWELKMLSVDATSQGDKQLHVEARLHYRSADDPSFIEEFARLERLVSHRRCKALLELGHDDSSGDDDVEVLRGRNVYRAFKEVVDYPELYRGVRSVVGYGNESAGLVRKRHQGQTWLDVPLSDSFSQVGGIWVNLMTELAPGEMYIATGCEASLRSPNVKTVTDGKEHGFELWHVFAQHWRKSEKEYTTDVFVFDAKSGVLTEAMLGVQYAKVARESMSKMLRRLTKDESVLKTMKPTSSAPTAPVVKVEANAIASHAPTNTHHHPTKDVKSSKKSDRKPQRTDQKSRDITDDVRNLVASVSGIDAAEFSLDTEMVELGIDSLMGMELAREVESVFKCTLDQQEQMEATSLRKFIVCVQNALGQGGNGAQTEDDGDVVLSGDDGDDDANSDYGDGDNTWSRRTPDGFVSSDISTPDEDTDSYVPQQEKPAVPTCAATSNLTLSRTDVLECFGEVKMHTDELIRAHGLDTIHKTDLAGSNRLCAALVVEALETLGMPLRTATAGQVLQRVPFQPQHQRLMACVYEFLERDARLVDIDPTTGQLTRTHVAAPRKSRQAVLDELLKAHPGFAVPNRITHYAGKSLAEVLSGATDGIRVIFGTPEGREHVAAMYCEHSFNRMNYLQMRDVVGRLVERVRATQPGQTLKILEMGAGTGGTTLVMAPFLQSLDIPVEYTFTDLSPSMVANARRRFGQQYPFMRFAVHDIEKAPADQHKGQHIVLASNAIHATRNLVVSARNVREALRPDGFLMILEMTEAVPFVDLVFGLLEGWWLFDDGRKHAVVPPEHWERELQAAGFGHVDWTDGNLPENDFQRVIIGLASGKPEPSHLPKAALPSGAENSGVAGTMTTFDRGDVEAREAEAEGLVKKYTRDWATLEVQDVSTHVSTSTTHSPGSSVVLVTGATGSLGAHLVQAFATRSDVATVVCINRPSSKPVEKRQQDAFSSRGIELSAAASKKLRVLEADTSEPRLGLPEQEYKWLVENGTHIVHNAWPMSGTRPLRAFEPQLQAMRNMLDLARDIAVNADGRRRVGFQFVSSIGVVGFAGTGRIPETRVRMRDVMPGGYTEAKWACERMLDETMHRFPRLFRAMVVRPGQIAGSSRSGFWNPVEHFAFLVKSAQSLRVWPDLEGTLQWLPVDRCAEVMADLLRIGDEATAVEPYPVYHIDNPVGQPWKDMSPVLAEALGIPHNGIIPFDAWIKLVRRSPLPVETENPAARLVDFLEFHFPRMSCGGLILDTQRAKEHSITMAREGPVAAELGRLYVAAWKKMGYLHA